MPRVPGDLSVETWVVWQCRAVLGAVGPDSSSDLRIKTGIARSSRNHRRHCIANRNRPMRKMTKGRSGNMYEPTRASQHRSGDQCQECRVSIFPSFCGITSLSREAGSPSFRACKRGMGIEDLEGEEDVFDLLQSE